MGHPRFKLPPSPFSTPLSGSAREAELRVRSMFQWKKRRPPLWLLGLAAALCLLCGSLVSCQSATPSAGQSTLPEHAVAFSWEGLDLDGRGEADDRAVITTWEPWSVSEGSTVLEVTLGTGEQLTWEWDLVSVRPRLLPARLEPGRPQSLVIELADSTSNYSGASYFILEVKEGSLVQRGCLGSGSYTEDDLLPEALLVSGAQLLSLPDGCQVVRVPALYDKCHDYIWGTLAPEGEGLSFTSDGCFTDYLSLQLADGRELTLALHCTVSSPYLSEQTYDQIQIWDGDTLLQTIDSYTLPADPATPFAGYSLSPYFHPSAEIRDINFDGCQDFGLICDTDLYGTRCWFVWDGEAEQYTYLAALGDRLTFQPELGQLTVELPNADFSALVPHRYRYDAQGALAAVS